MPLGCKDIGIPLASILYLLLQVGQIGFSYIKRLAIQQSVDKPNFYNPPP